MPRLTFPSRIPSSSSPAAAAFSFASTSRLPLRARASSSHCCTQKQILHHQPQSPPPPSAQCTTGVSSRNLSGSAGGEATTSSLVRQRDAHPSSTFSLTALRTALPSLSSSRSSASSFSGTALLSSVRPSISLPLRATPQPSSVRFVTYGSEYQPSQLKRKRKHGFLARLKKKNGRKILIRRRLAGRRFLSH